MAIVLLNVIVFIATLALGGGQERTVEASARAVATYRALHPYLELQCKGIDPDARQSETPSTVTAEEQQAEQGELDGLCQTYDADAAKLTRFIYGYVPARGGLLTLFTHQFLHGGFLHIGFNLWFLWLCGTNLEDRWGRVVFPAFYLAAGAAGALAHRTMSPGSLSPLIGASGAIAGAMGGFLVTYAATRIVFFYAYFFTKPKWGTFGAPAYVMLPLWLVSELFDAVVSSGDGTSHWAHVGGFVFGVVISLGFKLSGVDAKLDAIHERAVSQRQDPRLLAAMEMTDAGRAREALAELAPLARESPTNIDVQLETLRAATAAQDLPRRVEAYLRLVVLYIDSGSIDTAADLWSELRLHDLEVSIPRAERLRMGELFGRKGRADTALVCVASAHADGLVDPVAVRAAVLHATLLVRAGRPLDARPLLEEARVSPFSTHELDQKIEAQLAAIEARSGMEMGVSS